MESLGFVRKGSRLPMPGVPNGRHVPDEELLRRLERVKVPRVVFTPGRVRIRVGMGPRRRYPMPWIRKRGGWDRAYFGKSGQGEIK